MIVKAFSSEILIQQVRAGKLGDNLVFITYSSTSSQVAQFRLEAGTIPNLFLIEVTKLKRLKSDVKYNKLLMNKNEDLRTFENGDLIWATANKDEKLTIFKIIANKN